MNISHNTCVGNSSRVTPTHFSNSYKNLGFTSFCNSTNIHELPKPHISRITHDDQTSLELCSRKTITVLISFLKLSQYDDAWLKLGKQLLLLKKSTKKQKRYTAASFCFKSSIKAHPDNYVAYYFSGLTLCLLGRYDEAVRMFFYSLRYNKETSTALMHTLTEMLSITEGIRLVAGDSNSSNNVESVFNRSLDKLERKIIRKLQRCNVDGVVRNSMTKEQNQWNRYFELGMYWHGREQGDHKALMYFRRCLQLNSKNESANYYVGQILQKQERYQESLEAYNKAISLRPEEGFYYYMASQIYMQLEESKKALEMIDTAIALSPSDIAYKNMKEQILHAFGIELDLVDMTLKHCNNDHLTTRNNTK